VIVGSGPAGIATAAGLKRRGLDPIVLERGGTVAPAWRNHYDRLHLHTNKGASDLPGRPMPDAYPKYPSRDQVSDYLEDYAAAEEIQVRLNTEAAKCRRIGGLWETATTTGENIESTNLVMATGLNQIPNMPRYPKQELYEGEIIHSADYRNGRPYVDKFVLVVGFGNSAGEIALDLMEHGAQVFISVRSPSVVVPRDIIGITALTIARWLSVFPPKVGDWLSKPILGMTVGDLSRLGIPKSASGPLEQIAAQQKIPMLDVGTIDAMRSGEIKARPGIDRFTEKGVIFTGGNSEPFDAVIFATGFEPGVDRILDSTEGVLDEHGRPLVSGGVTAEPGLFFCGFVEPPTGRLRSIGIEAEQIADLIAADVGSGKPSP
jgi:cation diffusion facilitator CzcD-associated flavoprotein CzcO